MITNVSIPSFLLSDHSQATARGTGRPATDRVEAAPKSTEWQRRPHQAPSTPFMAQLIGQKDDGLCQDVLIGKIQSYPDHRGDDVFGPGVDILPMNFRLMDLRV